MLLSEINSGFDSFFLFNYTFSAAYATSPDSKFCFDSLYMPHIREVPNSNLGWAILGEYFLVAFLSISRKILG